VLLSICASATRSRLKPWAHLRDGFDQLAVRSGGGDVGDLLPDDWANRQARRG
jgi:transposase